MIKGFLCLHIYKKLYIKIPFSISIQKKPHYKIPDNGTLKVSANPDVEVTFVVGPKTDSVTIPIEINVEWILP